MKAPKQIAKPENRQDFESLCKKLRGEVWQCPEIKKNGRRGQKQAGVDVYGIPKEEKDYWGIQAKDKDDYTNAKLTKKEIDEEIKKTKTFKPQLAKFYFATTANKDAKIEEYVREINIKHMKEGLFEVHLYCWEDIIDLIEENPDTYNYYINSISFKNNNSVSLTFEGDTEKMVADSYFLNTKKVYKYENSVDGILGLDTQIRKMMESCHPFGEYKGENMSVVSFKLRLENTGNQMLENYKVDLEFEGAVDTVFHTSPAIPIVDRYTDCWIREDTMSGILKEPKEKPLVSRDSHLFDEINIIPNLDGGEVIIRRTLLSKHFNTKGILKLTINTHIIDHEEVITVSKVSEERVEGPEIEYFYFTKERQNKLKKIKENG